MLRWREWDPRVASGKRLMHSHVFNMAKMLKFEDVVSSFLNRFLNAD